MKINAHNRFRSYLALYASNWRAYSKSSEGFPQGVYLENFLGVGSLVLVIPDYVDEVLVVANQEPKNKGQEFEYEVPMSDKNALTTVNKLLSKHRVPSIPESVFIKGFSV